MKVLLNWSGRDTDPLVEAPSAEQKPGVYFKQGPQLQFLSLPGIAESFDLHVIFAAQETHIDGEALRAELRRRRINIRQEIRTVDINDPTDYQEIRNVLKQELKLLKARFPDSTLDLTILLTPGTPQMRISWLVLVATGAIKARLIETVPLSLAQEKNIAPWKEIKVDQALALDELESMNSNNRFLNHDFMLQGESLAIQKLREQIEHCSKRKENLLIEGEVGTHQESIARLIIGQEQSNTLVFSCSEKLLQTDADAFLNNITPKSNCLFLDVDCMPLQLQDYFYSYLHQNTSTRIISTAHLSGPTSALEKRLDEKTLHAGWYQFLSPLRLKIPALKSRSNDVIAMARFFANKKNCSLSEDLESTLPQHSWPGNTEELVHMLSEAVKKGPQKLTVKDLPSAFQQSIKRPFFTGTSLQQQLNHFEQNLIMKTLEECRGNHSEAARRLAMGRSTLRRKLIQYNKASTKK